MPSRYRKIEDLTHRSRSRNGSRSQSPVKTSSVRESRMDSALKAAEEERDYYKREFELQVAVCRIITVDNTFLTVINVG